MEPAADNTRGVMQPLAHRPPDGEPASTPECPVSRPKPRRLAACLLAALAFGLAYSQAPLYTSNQNQYFLHGAARAGLGFLHRDWLANTADPTPVFTWIVEWTYRLLPPATFHLDYLLLLGLGFAALGLLAEDVYRLRDSALRSLLFVGLLIGLNSAALRFAQARLLGEAWEYLWDGGLAGQRLLGPVLQPSAFGVLLLLSIALYARRRPGWASGLAALGACFHPTYLLSAGLLVLAYCLLEWRRTRHLIPALRIGLVALVLVTPILLYVALVLGPTSPGLLAESQRILVEDRIPHHALPAVWFDASSVASLALIAAALWKTRHTRAAPPMALAALGAAVLTALQVGTGSRMLGLLFPWRISVVLVPASTALLAGWAAERLARSLEPRGPKAVRAAQALSLAAIGLLAASGILAFQLQRAREAGRPAAGLFRYVRSTAAQGETYLIPPQLQEFRLATGAPAFADFKSIPYRDVDVIEWGERMRLIGWIYRDDPGQVDCSLFDEVARRSGVTHVVLDQDLLSLDCPALSPVYRDESYALAEIGAP